MSDDGKKLYRTQEDRMIAGVCTGLAAYFNIDVTLIRVIFVVLALLGGGILLYLLLWIFIPDQPDGSAESEPELSDEVEEVEQEEKV
ncbi:MAG TPA: PspC domain-containing protein [candidate division Zixibacteria bacterium]|nr:PspC domain-containing protein [candidate division Zixibacteria bacterium]